MTALEMGFFAIPAETIDAAKKFYGPVMGWDFSDRARGYTAKIADPSGNTIGFWAAED